ncbi:hypothetical protein [Amycolatopsis sp. SID8362]|uniref:hypothetical protein n=1 Tax=Amycolatopsis sp. SID8362 TaxID=2690346 RepID=UPI00136E5303|nr:hypothetical protein [Amycolatopsis sp. SID8362]NBH09519.1 hypothetical protein [Amycolatopsis sp. SID8362]NED46211.1 hypothetical protein [Amycolatopsis sp. SID8362]
MVQIKRDGRNRNGCAFCEVRHNFLALSPNELLESVVTVRAGWARKAEFSVCGVVQTVGLPDDLDRTCCRLFRRCHFPSVRCFDLAFQVAYPLELERGR